MRTLKEILEHIENKKRKVVEENRRIYGDELENVKDLFPIVGYNIGFDMYWLTEDLTDEEFEVWYRHKQEVWWKENGGKVKCLKCGELINEPRQMIKWAGRLYHGNCFVSMVEAGEYVLPDEHPYYERIKRVVFKITN